MKSRTITPAVAAADAAAAAGYIVRCADAHDFDPLRAAVADLLVGVAREHRGDVAAIAVAIVSRLPAAIAEAERLLQAEQTDCRRLRT